MAVPEPQQSYAQYEPTEDSCEGFTAREIPVGAKVLLGRRPASSISVGATVSMLLPSSGAR